MGLLLLMGLVGFTARCGTPVEEKEPELGSVRTWDGKPVPPEAAYATTPPPNPFVAAGVDPPGGGRKKIGGGSSSATRPAGQ